MRRVAFLVVLLVPAPVSAQQPAPASPPESFLKAYLYNRRLASMAAIEDSPVARAARAGRPPGTVDRSGQRAAGAPQRGVHP